jgi:hypothetical protein
MSTAATDFTLNYPKSIDNQSQNIFNIPPNDVNKPSESSNSDKCNNNNTFPENWDFMVHLYFGSITVVGLYILFKLMQHSK